MDPMARLLKRRSRGNSARLFGALLALHVGLVAAIEPASAGGPGTGAAPTLAMPRHAALPCHHEQTATQAGDEHAPCCAADSCHCAGPCALAAAALSPPATRLRGTPAESLIKTGALPPALARELRPPIAD
jgi:hypothetical protein